MPTPTSTALVLPSTNLHGTPVEERNDATLAVRSAVRAMIRTLDAAAPNGRDYYPQGSDALRLALAGHGACSQALTGVGDELLALADEGGEAVAVSAFLQATPEKPAATPTIHLNGTSAEGLKVPAVAVFRAAQAAEEAFRQIVPNGRDYDTQESWVAARAQHLERVAIVKRVGGYFLQIAMVCRATGVAAQASSDR